MTGHISCHQKSFTVFGRKSLFIFLFLFYRVALDEIFISVKTVLSQVFGAAFFFFC